MRLHSAANAGTLALAGQATYVENFSTFSAAGALDRVRWSVNDQTLQLDRSDPGTTYLDDALVVTNGSGRFWVVWVDGRNPTLDIYAQQVDADGHVYWDDDVRVNAYEGYASQYAPAAAVGADGNLLVVWQDNRSRNDIYAQRVDVHGTRLWANDLQVSRTHSGTAPSLTLDPSGTATVVWADGLYTDSGIYAQRVSPGGALLWPDEVQVNSVSGAYELAAPSVSSDSANTIVVAWTDFRNGHRDIFAQRLDGSGARLWGTDVRVNSDVGAAAQFDAATARDPNGHVVVAWSDERNGDLDVYTQVLNSSGARDWPTDRRLNQAGSLTTQDHVAIAVKPTGEVVATWHDSRDGTEDIYAQGLQPNGASLWSSDQRVSGDQYVANQVSSLALDGSGDLVVVWVGGTGQTTDVYLQRLLNNGQRRFSTEIRVNTETGPAVQNSATIVADTNGQYVLSWTDNRYGAPERFVRRIDSSGNHLWAADISLRSGSILAPMVARSLDPDGRLWYFWLDLSSGTPVILAQKLDRQGNRVWAQPIQVNVGEGPAIDDGFSVTSDTAGHVLVAWLVQTVGGPELRSQRLNAAGIRLWSSDRLVKSDSAMTLTSQATFALSPSGTALVVWQAGSVDLFAQSLDAEGNPRWPEAVQVNGITGNSRPAYSAAAVLAADGSALIAWSGNVDIHAQKLDAIGARQWATDVTVNSGGIPRQTINDLAMAPDGSMVVVWSDGRPERSDVMAQKLDGFGTRLWGSGVRVNSDPQMSPPPISTLTFNCCGSAAVDSQGNTYFAWVDNRNHNYDIYAQSFNTIGNRRWLTDLQVVYPDQFYFASGTAESVMVDTLAEGIGQAMLTAEVALNGGTVDWELTNDGGAHWEAVTPGVTHVFTSSGSDLRWRATLGVDRVWGRTPVVSGLRIEYTSEGLGADAYESDDSCALARPLQLNGAGQAHTFHQAGDTDWLWFETQAGQSYVLQTGLVEARADTTLALYGSCGGGVQGSDANAFGGEARLTWTAASSGRVYVAVQNASASVFGAQTGYEVAVREAAPQTVAVIVAGGNAGRTLQTNIAQAADQAYRTLLAAGVAKGNIRYLGPDVGRDVDGNGAADDVSGVASVASVREAVQNWARERGVGLGVAFYLYLVDHGQVDTFLVNASGEQISAGELDLWLSNLEATSGADEITVVIEACLSGSFIDATTGGPGQISGPNRVVVTSTSSGQNAYATVGGAQFSDVFWSALAQDQDVATAYAQARAAVTATGLSQVPWLDDNGDGVADSQDGVVARSRGLRVGSGHAPVIDWAEWSGGSGQIRAQVRDDGGVAVAWAMVYPPGFVEPAPSVDGTTPELNLVEVELVGVGGNVYMGSYAGFTSGAGYRVVVYAADTRGNQALPVAATAAGAIRVFLPGLSK